MAQVWRSLAAIGVPEPRVRSDEVVIHQKRKHVDVPSGNKKRGNKVAKTSSVQQPTINRPRRQPRVPGQYCEVLPDVPMPLPQEAVDDDCIPDTNDNHDPDSIEDPAESRDEFATPDRDESTFLEQLRENLSENDAVTILRAFRSGLCPGSIERYLPHISKHHLHRYKSVFEAAGLECPFSAKLPRCRLGRRTDLDSTAHPDGRLGVKKPRRVPPILQNFHERGTVDIKVSVGGEVIMNIDYLVEGSYCFALDPVRGLFNITPYLLLGEIQVNRLPLTVVHYFVYRICDHQSRDIIAGN